MIQYIDMRKFLIIFIVGTMFVCSSSIWAISSQTLVLPDEEQTSVTELVEENLIATVDGSSEENNDETKYDAYANDTVTPDESYRQLVAGNARYLKEDSQEANVLPSLVTDEKRFPIATILYSSDMTLSPTLLTQTTDHDVYLAEIKVGAVSTEDLAAIEYGLLNLKTPLLVVLGHYPSRDISNFIRKFDELENNAKSETKNLVEANTKNIPKGMTTDEMKIYNLLGPAIARSRSAYPDLQGYELANVVSEALVWQSIETILMKSTVAQDLVRSGNLNIIAALTDNKTGKIYWLGEHPLQEEFLKPMPEDLQNKEEPNEILLEDDLQPALNDSVIEEYALQYSDNTYYSDVVTAYYEQPVYYVPSWELFRPHVWLYRPWCGIWVRPFVPWPYWSPWGYPPGIYGSGVSISGGRLNLYIGFNRCWETYHCWDSHFRPRCHWWCDDFFLEAHHHHRGYVSDLIWHGQRCDIPMCPPNERECFHHRELGRTLPHNEGFPPRRPSTGGKPIGSENKPVFHPGDMRPRKSNHFNDERNLGMRGETSDLPQKEVSPRNTGGDNKLKTQNKAQHTGDIEHNKRDNNNFAPSRHNGRVDGANKSHKNPNMRTPPSGGMRHSPNSNRVAPSGTGTRRPSKFSGESFSYSHFPDAFPNVSTGDGNYLSNHKGNWGQGSIENETKPKARFEEVSSRRRPSFSPATSYIEGTDNLPDVRKRASSPSNLLGKVHSSSLDQSYFPDKSTSPRFSQVARSTSPNSKGIAESRGLIDNRQGRTSGNVSVFSIERTGGRSGGRP